MNEAIVNIKVEHKVDYSERILNYIIEKSDSTINYQPSYNWFSFLDTHSRIITALQEAKETVFIQSNLISDSKILETLLSLEQSGVRIYILLNELQLSEKFVSALRGKAIFRIGVNLLGSIILIDSNSSEPKGFVYSDSLEEKSLKLGLYPCLRLELEQIPDISYLFSHYFWNEAKQEIISGSAPISVSESPFGEVPLTKDYHSKSGIENILSNTINSKLSLNSLREDFWKKSASLKGNKLLLTHEFFDFDILKQVSMQNEVFLRQDPNLFQFSIGEESYFFPIKNVHFQYAVPLTERQSVELVDYLKDYQYWVYSTRKYSSIQNSFSFIGEKAAHEIVKVKSETFEPIVSLGILLQVKNQIQATYEKIIEEGKSKERLSKEPFANEVYYSLNVKPYSIPKSTERDPLQIKWDEIQTRFQKKLKEMLDYSEIIEEQKKSLAGKVLDSLKSLFAGKAQKKNVQMEEIQNIQSISILDTPKNRESLVQRINQMIQEINHDSKEIHDKIEEETQRIAWEEKKEKLDKELIEIENNWKGKSALVAKFDSDFEGEKEVRQKEIDELEERIKGIEEEKEKKEINEKIEEKKKAFKAFENSKTQEKNGLEKDRDRLKSQKESKEKERKAHGDKYIQQKNQVSNESSLKGLHKESGNVSNKREISPLQLSFPAEEPPQVGSLFNYKSKRHLAIGFWEEYETALAEAQRLSAELCVLNHS
jgi:hypothetical protein